MNKEQLIKFFDNYSPETLIESHKLFVKENRVHSEIDENLLKEIIFKHNYSAYVFLEKVLPEVLKSILPELKEVKNDDNAERHDGWNAAINTICKQAKSLYGVEL